MNPNFTAPNLWNTFGALRAAACDYAPPPSDSSVGPLMRAAVAFTTQLAIDAAGRDGDEAHALERELLSTLETWRNKDGAMELRLMIYDLECVIGALTQAAHRYTLLLASPTEILKQVMEILPRNLAVAAVAFTIQLAIDDAGREASAMRSLERALISRLEEPWEFGAVPLSVEGTHGETWGPPPGKD